MGVLDDIVVGVREDLAERQARVALARLEEQVAGMPAPRDLLAALGVPGLSLIAEVKRSSPSKGALADIPDPAALAKAYAAGGATAVSVLTERRRFGGDLSDLAAVRAAVDVGVLRKDFVVTDYQVWETRAAGADLLLLIVAALSDADLARLYALATRLGLTVLVEVHTADEVRRAVDLGAGLIGVNNRNLGTFVTDVQISFDLVEKIPDEFIKISESGISDPQTVIDLQAAGYRGFLMGENFMKTTDPGKALDEFIKQLG